MSEINEVWILASHLGMYSHKGNAYWVIRKYKRRPGYSARDVERLFSGYTNSGKTERFETFEEVLQFLADEHPTKRNYGFTIGPGEVLEVLENAEPEKREFWKEEIEYLRKLIGKPAKEWKKPEVKPTRQATLDHVME
ncbi:hypothetical protein [Thermococcus aciditolerans]|uniref:Uncharacterized protein n=1 Tax=Thermococcus aciditolerans TaxID=2598455 RepID=A0A5C0SJQ5_9EURY|nr:hypothetical protein [Thermococcus aciditolerans]QEK14735.1 hypothetical protein FPV09_06100 [Thermococcus aciditolerans]